VSNRLAVAGAAAVGIAAIAVAGLTLYGGAEPPYKDPAATGLITLCDADGKAQTEGAVDKPLASVVIGSSAAPKAYGAPGAVASLFAYQPREGIEPVEFSGLQLTGSSLYTDSKRPAVQVTSESTSIGDFVTAFPARDHGFVQLRLLLSAPHAGTQTARYDTADLQIEDGTWHVVSGGAGDCSDAAKAIAAEPTS
jgi:hypothetical protein